MSWMMHSVSPDIKSALLYVKTAAEGWHKLKVRYAQPNDLRIFQLQQEIYKVTQGNSSVTDYFSKVSSLWEELGDYRPVPSCICKLCTCSISDVFEKMQDIDKIFKFLMGLNDAFEMVRGQIILMDPKPSLDKAYSLVLQEETQKMSRELFPINENVAMNVGFKRKDKKGLMCPNCPNLSNHTIENCFKVNGFPQHNPRKIPDGNYNSKGSFKGRGGRFNHAGRSNQFHVNNANASGTVSLTNEQLHQLMDFAQQNGISAGNSGKMSTPMNASPTQNALAGTITPELNYAAF
ncbi:hypothetical protein CASFOL_031855 [Castilleja foliolosa]|uniref:Retrotransposon gag domain-containing protein n=1 Tax=Castilleja foliolosa TaxID=1961234 RepID=A0ABD3C0F8_9LAMI